MLNKPRNQQVKMNYEHLCDLHILLCFIVFYFYWNLCMLLLSSDKWGLCLCVTLWLLSRFAKVIYATHVLSRQSFNFILKPLFGPSSCCLNACMKTSKWNGHPILIWSSTFGLWGKWAMHWELETMMPTFVTEDVFVMESLMKNQWKGKSSELSSLQIILFM